MFSYLQMPFLQALGYAITNSVWQVFLLWLIVLLVNSFTRQSSHIKYVTAVSGQVAGFMWFLTTFQFYYRHCHAASVQAEQFANGNSAVYLQNIVSDNNMLSFFIRAEEILPYLSVAYLFLLLYLVVKWVQNFRFTKLLSSNGLEAIDARWQLFVNEMADKLSVMQSVKIHLSSIAKSPLTIGYLKPIILLPVASLNFLTTEQLEAVILHELAHIRRADYITNLLVSVAEMIMFFNPFTRLISRVIQKERENSCDDWVLQNQYSAGMYAEALLRIACLQREGFQMNAASQQKGELLQRVKRIVQPSEKKFSYRHQVTAMMFIAGLLFCIAWLQPDENDYHKPAVAINTAENKKVVIAPMIAQVDNPFFNGASLFNSSLHDDVLESVNEWNKTIADSAAATGIREAQKAIAKAAPLVMATMSSGNWNRIIKEAAAGAAQSLQNIRIQSPELMALPIPDSAFLLQTINSALSKTNRLNEVQLGLNAAKKELEKLQHDKTFGNGFNFSTDFLNQLSANALASLQNFHFEMAQDSLQAAVDRLKQISEEQNRKARQQVEKQTLLMKKMQEQAKTFGAIDKRSLPPVPPPAPHMPSDIEKTITEDTATTYNIPDDIQLPAYNWSFTEPVIQHDNPLQDKTSKTIHITSNSDKKTINIVIEIRQ